MGAKTLISPEEYLSMSFEWEPEYVGGELRQRPMPEYIHGYLIGRLSLMLGSLAFPELTVVSGVRCRMPNGNHRLPDVALFRGAQPAVPVEPAVAIVEILSRDDSYDELLEKLLEYEQWGVAHVWVINPRLKMLQQFHGGSLQRVDSLKLPEYGFEVRYEQLVEKLPTNIAPTP
jgi:Uma2 family endonuclease